MLLNYVICLTLTSIPVIRMISAAVVSRRISVSLLSGVVVIVMIPAISRRITVVLLIGVAGVVIRIPVSAVCGEISVNLLVVVATLHEVLLIQSIILYTRVKGCSAVHIVVIWLDLN